MGKAVQIFRLVATEFETLNDEVVNAWLDLTAPLISEKVFGKLYDQALALLTAHRLKMAGYGDSSYGTVGDTLRIGSYLHRVHCQPSDKPDGRCGTGPDSVWAGIPDPAASGGHSNQVGR